MNPRLKAVESLLKVSQPFLSFNAISPFLFSCPRSLLKHFWQLPRTTCRREGPVYSRFPAHLLNAIEGIPSSHPNAWRRPTTPMPRCRILLSVPEEQISKTRPNARSSYFYRDRKTNDIYTLPGVTQSILTKQAYYKTSPNVHSNSTYFDPIEMNNPMRLSGLPYLSQWLDPERLYIPRRKRQGVAEQKNLNVWWKDLIDAGVLQPCESSELAHIAPLFRVPKGKVKRGEMPEKWRWIVDFRYLNRRTQRSIGNTIPVTRYDIRDFIAWVACQPHVLKMDLSSAFYSCPAEPSSQRFFGVQNGQQFCYFNSLPMGITDGPDIFSYFMNWVMSHLPESDRDWIKNYQDDIFVAGATPDICRQRCRRLNVILEHFGLSFNPEKSVSPEIASSSIGVAVLGTKIQTGGTISIPPHRQRNMEERFELLIILLNEYIERKESQSLCSNDLSRIRGAANQFSYVIPNLLFLFRFFIKDSHIDTCLTESDTADLGMLQLSSLQEILVHLKRLDWCVHVIRPCIDIDIKIRPTSFPSLPGWEVILLQSKPTSNSSDSSDSQTRDSSESMNNVVWRCHLVFHRSHCLWNCLNAKEKEAEGLTAMFPKLCTILKPWNETRLRLTPIFSSPPKVSIQLNDPCILSALLSSRSSPVLSSMDRTEEELSIERLSIEEEVRTEEVRTEEDMIETHRITTQVLASIESFSIQTGISRGQLVFYSESTSKF